MSSQPPDSSSPSDNLFHGVPRNLLIALYALVTIFVLILTIYLSIRALSPQPQTIPTILPDASVTPALIPTRTTTPSPSSTARPTFTPRPSLTPSITPTPSSTPTATLLPSLTPAFPRTEGQIYNLVDWTPELADRLIEHMQAYPRTLSAFARGQDNAGFYDAFSFAVLAQREALLQFPAAPQADQWLWDLAFNLARVGDPAAGEAYAVLIANELNQGTVDLSTVSTLDDLNDPRVNLELTSLDMITGYLSNHVVKVFSEENGGAIIWLLERSNGFEAHALATVFDFVHPTSIDFFVEDLTRDGNQEIVIFRSAVPGNRVYDIPRIFSLTTQPPDEIFFEPVEPPPVSADFQVQWAAVENGVSQADLQFVSMLFPPCPVKLQHTYKWNGKSFEFFTASYTVEPNQELLGFCDVVVNHAIRSWGPGPTIQIMETVLPFWPPEQTVDGDPYPEDALDQWRHRLGIYHALDGNMTRAKEYLQGITINPAIPDSSWIDPASEFLETYQDQRDIYRACLLTDFCDPREAIRAVVATFSGDDYSNALQILSDAGLLIRSSGFFDFDVDGATERWLILRATARAKPEFWILAQTEEGVEALIIDQVEETQPRITLVDPNQEPPIVQLGRNQTFVLQKAPSGLEIKFVEPVRVFSVDLTQEKLDELEAALLGGDDPAETRQQLLNLEGSSFFTCNFNTCPKFHYLLGLANELSGNEQRAVISYLTLWQEFSRSPFTTMARLKLEGIPPTPTPTLSPTATLTLTPTITPTVTPTATAGAITTSTGTPTPGASPTPIEGYPPPEVFPTSTAASYPAPTP